MNVNVTWCNSVIQRGPHLRINADIVIYKTFEKTTTYTTMSEIQHKLGPN